MTDTGMVEKVARAMCSHHYEIRLGKAETDPHVLMNVEGNWHTFVGQASVGMEAMLEPTKEMIDPGYTAMDEAIDFYNYDSGAGYSVDPLGPAAVWRAMIQAALKEQG